jgi:YD repeat-containing protein
MQGFAGTDPYANPGSQVQPPLAPLAVGGPAACTDPILVGHPINTTTGNAYLQEVDYQGAGPFPLAFIRYYNSGGDFAASGGNFAVPQTNLGVGWRHNYDRQILVEDATDVVVVRPNGQAFQFTLAGGVWSSTIDVVDKLQTAGAGWQLVTQNDETEIYSSSGLLTTIANRAGLTQTLTYSTASTPASIAPQPGLLITVTDPAGRQLNFTYDSSSRIVTMTDPTCGIWSSSCSTSQVYRYAYSPDTNSNLVSTTYPGSPNPVRNYSYGNAAHTLTGIQDENTQPYASYTYDSTTGRATQSSLGGPSIQADPYTLKWNTNGTTSVTDASTTRVYTFQTNSGIARVSGISQPCEACGSSSLKSVAYDNNAFISSATDWNNNVTTYQRNDPTRKDLETSRTEASGSGQARVITTQWHTTFRLPLKIAEPKRITTYQYDANGNQISLSHQATTDTNGSQGFNATPTGNPRTWTYSNCYPGSPPVCNPTAPLPQLMVSQAVDGPRTDAADVTTYTFRSATDTGNPPAFHMGDLWKITNALGHVTQITQNDANGRPLSMTDPNGLVTTFTYDPRGRIKTVTRGGRLTTYNYDKVGNLTSVIWPDGTQATYGYDAAHRLTTITDQLGETRRLTLDPLGNITQDQLSDPQGYVVRTQTQIFDNLGRLWKQIDALNNTTVLGYDPQSNLKTVTDPKPQTSTYGYDALNRVVSLTDAMTPTHGVTNVVLDGLDQLTQVTAPNGAQTSYQVDGLGNVASESSPDRGSTSYTYDDAGNLKTRTDARGIQFQVTFTYDELNRLKSVSYPNSSENVTLTYDTGVSCGAGAIGRLCSVQDAGGTVNYTYDLFGNVTAVTRIEQSVNYAQTFGYDNLDRLTRQVTPDNKSISAPRDALGRNAGLTTPVAGSSTNVLSQLKWRADNQLFAQTFGNHTAQTIFYDAAGRFQSSQSGPVPTSVPTLPQWGVVLLGVLLAGLGWRAQRSARA